MTTRKPLPKTPKIVDAQGYWPYQVVVLADLVARHILTIVKSHSDLNHSQWRALAAIAESPDCTAAHVVAVTPMDKGIVSRAVAELIKNDLVLRTPDPRDSRRASLRVTQAGRERYDGIAKQVTDSLSHVPELGVDFSSMLLARIQAMKDKQTR